MTKPIGPFTIRLFVDGRCHDVLDAKGRTLLSCSRLQGRQVSKDEIARLTREDAEKAVVALTSGQPVHGWCKAWLNMGDGYTICDADGVIVGYTAYEVQNDVKVLTGAEAAALGDLLTGGRCNSTSWRWERESP